MKCLIMDFGVVKRLIEEFPSEWAYGGVCDEPF